MKPDYELIRRLEIRLGFEGPEVTEEDRALARAVLAYKAKTDSAALQQIEGTEGETR